MSQALPMLPPSVEQEPAKGEFSEPRSRVHRVGNWLLGLVPAFQSLRHYSVSDFQADGLAGLTVATLALPQAMAYAAIAGVPAEQGLYTAIVATAVGALFASSRQLIHGPTNALSIAVLSALAPIQGEDKITAAVVLALLVGIVQLGIALLRLGDLTRYISQAVIVGFTIGAAMLLVLDQTKNLLGLPARGEPADHFVKRFWLTISQDAAINVPTVLIGVGTIALVVALRWLNTRLPRSKMPVVIPEFLTAVVVMAVLVWACRLDEKQVRIAGKVPASLPPFQVPHLRWELVQRLTGSSLALAVLGLLEALAMAKMIAARTGQKLDLYQQCLSEGIANVAGSFFQCIPGSGSLTRSAVNQHAGAVTQWSGIISAGAVAVTVLLFGHLARYIPQAALAGLLLVTAWRMIDRPQLLYHLRATRFDAGIVVATALAAVFVSVEFCILVGIFLSFVLYVPRAARLQLTEYTLTPERVVRERVPEDPPCGRMLLFNLEGELFFGAAPALEAHLSTIRRRAGDGIKVIILRMKRVRNPDAVCLKLLDDFVQAWQAEGITVLFCGVRRDLAQIFRSTGLAARLGPEHIFHERPSVWSSTLDAIRYAYDLLGSDLCATCPRRNEIANRKEPWYYMI
jgi:SulP family sulfate permease